MSANITDLMQKELITLNLKSDSKEAAIIELSTLMEQGGFLNNRDLYLQAVMERENMGSTGLGMGIAIPHGKSDAVKRACVAFGKSKQGIDFKGADGSLAHLLFLIAVPKSAAANDHLKILAQLSRMLMHEDFREALYQTDSEQGIIDIIHQYSS